MPGIQAVFLLCWLMNHTGTDSFHNVYSLCALLGLCCLYDNFRSGAGISRECRSGAVILSVVFSVATVLANYPVYDPVRSLISLFNIGCSLAGGFFLAYHVLLCALRRLPMELASCGRSRHSALVFLGCWGSIAAFFLLYLFFVGYPGYLTTDSLNSINQLRSGVYLNNNPYWYTMVIRACLLTGEAIFGDVNAAVACYSAMQILVLSGCFAWCLLTLYQTGFPMWSIAAVYAVYTFLPYNITYSITMWKDILFSASALLIAVSMYRLLRNIGGSRFLNYAVFALGSVGFCLMRTNGWYAYLVTAIVLFIGFRKNNGNLLKIMVAVLLACWILINPVQNALHVGETDFVETLSVPLQQIARVVASGKELEEAEQQFLSEIFWLDQVAKRYSPEIVDPIKFETIRVGGKEFLKENFGQFLRVWIKLGLRYPGEYVKAWVELTKGFWNGGYYFWIYLAYTYPETSGIGGFVMDNPIKDVFDALFRYTEKPVIMRPLYSIGLHTWVVVVCSYVCSVKKRQEVLLTIAILVLLAGLWVGTPVYAEYRYAYPMFTTCPLILLGTMFAGGRETGMEQKPAGQEET